MIEKQCRNCKHISKQTISDIGGIMIARCMNPEGVLIGDTPIKMDFVEIYATCEQHELEDQNLSSATRAISGA